MHQPYGTARTFTRRFLLGCLALSAVLLLLVLGGWLRSFTLTSSPPGPPDPVVAPPPATVTVTATPPAAAPAEKPARRGRASATFSLPPGTDGAAQAACSARTQAAVLREDGRRAEAAAQNEVAEEAARASTVPALKDMKKLRPKEIASRLDTWCPRHFPDLKPVSPSASPRPTTSGERARPGQDTGIRTGPPRSPRSPRAPGAE
ncbi:hypothetical protein [Actinocorallia libanotica]|uniref:Uncharacterized protein n=1 Tax=Actinocorallia libanotica TaxID=46162 RepID=A0ABP4BFD3_9ACTN